MQLINLSKTQKDIFLQTTVATMRNKPLVATYTSKIQRTLNRAPVDKLYF